MNFKYSPNEFVLHKNPYDFDSKDGLILKITSCHLNISDGTNYYYTVPQHNTRHFEDFLKPFIFYGIEINTFMEIQEKFKSGTAFYYKNCSHFKGVRHSCRVDEQPVFRMNENRILVSTNYNFKNCFLNGVFADIIL